MKTFQEDIIRSNLAKASKQARRKNSDREITPEAEYFIEQSRIQRELIKNASKTAMKDVVGRCCPVTRWPRFLKWASGQIL